MGIPIEPVTGSKGLVGAGYDPQTNIMRVDFGGDSYYDYSNVTPELHMAFWAAPSQGSYLHTIIKPRREVKKIPKENPQ